MRKYRYYRWIVWGILAFVYLLSMFHRSAIGVIQADLTEEFNLTATQLAAFGSIYFYIYMAMQIPVGILSDLYGPRKLVTAGALVASAGSILFGFSQTLYAAYAARFLVGLGVSVCYVPLLSVQNRWFHPGEFGTLTGLAALVGNLGSVAAQTPLVLLTAIFTWKSTFIGLGIITVITAAACFFFVRNTPEEMGFPQIHAVPAEKKSIPLSNAMKAFLKNPHSWPAIIICFSTYGAHATLTSTFGQRYFMSSFPNCSEIEAGNYTLLCALGLAVGSLLINWLSDRCGKRKPFAIFTTVTNLTAWLVLIFFGPALPNYLIGASSFCIGASCSAIPLCISINKELNLSDYVGISTSVTNMSTIAGAAIIPIVVGHLLDRFAGSYSGQLLYSRAFFILIALAGIAVSASFFVSETNCKNID